MRTISKEYLLLFNAVTDAEESLHQLRETLVAVQQQAEELYQKHFGPLTLFDAGTDKRWNWIDEPWPWEV